MSSQHCQYIFPNGQYCQSTSIFCRGLCAGHGGHKQCDHVELKDGVFVFCPKARLSLTTKCYHHHCLQRCKHFTKDSEGNDIPCQNGMAYPSVVCFEHGGGKYCSGKPNGKFCLNRVVGATRCKDCKRK